MSGERIGTDDTTGESRRSWQRYLLAMRESLGVWAALAAGLWWALGPGDARGGEVARLLAWTGAAGAALAVLWARALRGRMRWTDAAQALVWLAPPIDAGSAGTNAAILAARAAASAVLVALAAGPSATWASLARALARLDQRAAGIALLAALLTLERLDFVVQMAGFELDPSWGQSLGRGLLEGRRFGVELMFTYGPLGYFVNSPYQPGLYWTKTVAYELVFGLVCSGFVAWAIARVPGAVERVLCALAALLLPAGQDAWVFLVTFSIGCWYLDRPGRGVLHESLASAVLVVLALVKFTWLMQAAVTWTIFALWCWRAHGAHRALRTPAIAAALLLCLWCALGQRALDLPRYLWSSWSIAGGYAGAMGDGVPIPELERLSVRLLALIGLVAAWNLLRRPSSARALALSLALCAGGFLAFKAGLVRGHGVTFVGFAGVAPFLISTTGEAAVRTRLDRLRRVLLLGTRASIVALAVPAWAEARSVPPAPSFYFDLPAGLAHRNLLALLDLDGERRRVQDESNIVRRQNAMPQVVARVGRESIDLLGSAQGALFANDLAWTPRPVFQSYVAYTPALLRANAEFLEGPSAPRYLLHDAGCIDGRLPNLEDTLALQIMSRDYRFVLEERGLLLLEHHPVAAQRRPAREVQIDAQVPFGEWIDIGGTAGSAHLLQIEFERTLEGALLEFLLRPPPLFMELEDSRGRTNDFRVIPAMMTAGVFAQPFAIGPGDWREWFTTGDAARMTRVRLHLGPDGSAGAYRPSARLRLIRADDLVPDRSAVPSDATVLLSEPAEINTLHPCRMDEVEGHPVLVVQAPAELVYEVEAGRYRVRGRYGLLPAAWEQGCSDGVRFSVLLRHGDGQKVLMRHMLDPRANESDRGVHELDLVVQVVGASHIVLRTYPAGDMGCDDAWWNAVEVLPVGPPR
jgi:hypothetical protein